jgi:thioesterase domain-containing protein/acyl carrier protein
MAGIYADVLGLERVGVDDSFFDLGGDSISAMRVIAAVNTALDSHLAVRTLFQAPSVSSLSQQLGRHDSEGEVVPVEILKQGTGVPLFCIHPAAGLSWPYQALGNYLDGPIIGIQQTLQGEEAEPHSIREIAKNYANRIQGISPTGPYNLLGWSVGGVVAHEIAIELQRRGCEIARLILLDAQPGIDSRITVRDHGLDECQIVEHILRSNQIDIPEQSGPLSYRQLAELVRQRQAEMGLAVSFEQVSGFLEFMFENIKANLLYQAEHVPDMFDGDVVIFSAARGEHESSLLQSWRPYVAGNVTEHSVDCSHEEMLTPESLSRYGDQLKTSLQS